MEELTVIKLSELIKELQQTLQEEGDIECYNTCYYIEDDGEGNTCITF